MRDKLQVVLERIERSCVKAGRPAGDIRLVAVTKTVALQAVREAVALGLTELGESRVQEAELKFEALKGSNPRVRWHMIGHLQRNKVNRGMEIFDCVQSVDSTRLVDAMERRASELNKKQDCLVQVKVSEEPSKTGLAPDALAGFLEYCAPLKSIRIQGLMCIPPYFEDPEQSRPHFARARKLFEKHFIASPVVPNPGPVLSMGMSHDFEIAIEEGSTMVRVGTALFGARPVLNG